MIDSVVKQDLQDLQDHLKSLHEKYGPDFFMFGVFGIEGDEDSEGRTPMRSQLAIVGGQDKIHFGIHSMLDKHPFASLIIDTIRCHLKHLCPMSSKTISEYRDMSLLAIKKQLEERIREEDKKDIAESVDEFLKSMGMK